jgi:general secretion pathway protein A
MYLEHFKLKEAPFKPGPNPRFLHMTDQHQDALEKCKFTINERSGLVAICGDIGMGKSSIARMLVNEVEDENCIVGVILNPSLMTEKAFLKEIMAAFDQKSLRSYADSLNAFQDFMLQSYQDHKNLVLIIDEAQRLTRKMLMVLHALHNFESDDDKFLQMVLIGQNELEKNMQAIPEFADRVSWFAKLQPLTLDDTAELIAFRWHAASGAKSSHPFTSKAISAIYIAAGGRPRKINQFCHASLLTAYQDGLSEITELTVDEAAKDLLQSTRGAE